MEKQFDKKICIRCENRITDNRNFVCEKCWNEASEDTKTQLEMIAHLGKMKLIDDEGELKC